MILIGLILACTAMADDDAQRHPAQPGVLFIEGVGAADATNLVTDADTGLRCWTWSWGALTVSDGSLPVTEALGNLSLPFETDLAGASRGHRLLFRDGEFPIDAPLLLTGDTFQLFASRGVLEVADRQLVLADRSLDRQPPGTQYLLFSGILLITIFMVMKTRARLKRS
jgi:hypothetical protein